jgi:molybdate transport system permease protein
MPINWTPLWLGLRVAGVATIGALLPGLWLAYLLATRQFAGRRVAVVFLGLLLATPSVLLASILLRPASSWIPGAAGGVAAALPLLVFGARSPLAALDGAYGNAARSLGISEWRIFWRVLLPLCWRPVLGASAVAFARVFAEWNLAAAL